MRSYERLHRDETISLWLAMRKIVYMTTVDGDEMILGKTTKLKHFGRVIEMFRRKFPSHDMWTTDYDNWYSKTKAWFSAACDRRRVEDACGRCRGF
mmetsp:Transcript_2223/g.5231  ORF Transcript_2223/g.5231 Transcript_2223/m.5231 type:complete len:96 (+) Transcript_2223:391-678(+)